MSLNSEKTENSLYFLLDQVELIKKRAEVLGKRLYTLEISIEALGKQLHTIEENHKEQCKITEKCQKKNRKFLSRIYRRQKNFIEKAEVVEEIAVESEYELKQEIERLVTSIKNLEKTTEDIVSRGATKDDITAAIGNLQVTQQITQQATVPQVITWYYV